jgi:hypothetical protein
MPHNVALPSHRYVWVDDWFVKREPEHKLLPAVWFGVSSHPGRSIGCHIMLESGATVIDLPLHALRSFDTPATDIAVDIQDVVHWDNFGWDMELFAPEYLTSLSVKMLPREGADPTLNPCGVPWFAIDWKANGWSDYPEQHKWLWIVAANDGIIHAVPQDRLMFIEKSFTTGEIPSGIKRQTEIWSAEE